jgi:hypothetical protein
MKPESRRAATTFGVRLGWSTTFALGLVLGSLTPLEAQSPPPVQGTMALEGSMKEFYRAANVIVVTTVDGMEHMYHFAKNLVVHGGQGSGVDALEGLREGNTVVVHYTVSGQQEFAQEIDRLGDEGLRTTEGKVARIDRKRKEITIRFANGTTETLRMTDRATAESSDTLDQAGAEGRRSSSTMLMRPVTKWRITSGRCRDVEEWMPMKSKVAILTGTVMFATLIAIPSYVYGMQGDRRNTINITRTRPAHQPVRFRRQASRRWA